MRIWTSEHIFSHSWETVTEGQWQKYPNPHNQAVIGTDVVERKVENGILHTNRIISSDWGLADWAQRILGANKVCYAHEYSMVNPSERVMEMHSRNLSFSNIVNMQEKMTYRPHPEDAGRTVMKQETVVTVQGVPLTSYMENIIVNTVSSNSNKGKAAIEWIVEKLGQECRSLSLSSSLEKLKLEMVDLKHTVADSLVHTARQHIDDLQARVQLDLQKLGSSIAQPVMLKAEDISSSSSS
ncbi:PRELI domain containing protein 3A [Eurytemora carolleeae]|uniref:PRELI domain containing protein 3A n=1 Tax=Eurytemora carolleeae TaxID=1294199 RepID=UPI000C75DB0A|nr:PRELI domain containing protein 3A [Eurytemora carolleeae]|eukprot:XP_023335079.1 PRELI domain containing protein 3A-like [Eurytemora affinis]